MAYIGTKDYNLEVLRGNVSGHTMYPIIGHDESLSTTKIVIHPTGVTINIDQSSIDATPATVKISSTSNNDAAAGTGLQTATLFGLDSSGDIQTETISDINGQTGSTSANTYSAIYGLVGLTAGSLNFNDGTVCHDREMGS